VRERLQTQQASNNFDRQRINRPVERINMLRNKKIWLVFSIALMLWACAEKEPVFPWVKGTNPTVVTQGKMVGYEFWAKW
jgi:hypothetical protein